VSVVEEDEGAPAFENAAVEARQLFCVVGEALFEAEEGADAGGKRVGRVAGRAVGAAHVEGDLGVGVGIAQALGDVEGELGLADAAHAADAGAATAAQRREQVGDLLLAPDEVTNGRA
jgi:hypothetical protein